MGLFQVLVDGGGVRQPGPRRHKGPEEQSPYLQHLHRAYWGLPWTMGFDVVKATLI